ncbi:aromatic ring-hydroxylating dioxygenase subunit alpha [Mesorhizobium sp. ASY16-5R]|uniref:aromatic ring-hydroxylating dioxygenase subunit alpha n=1 Tax=Mesorhizobium sp. ASY16-5R TaxID=3445772 RepID=UPI003F9EBC60
MYLRNTWYVATRSSDVARQLTPLTILGEKIVLYRQEDGTPVALEDACPHRKLPLSMGSLKGDHVICGYHGLTFGRGGGCFGAPTQTRVPSTATVRSYPVTDRWGLLWIWMGDSEAADESTIFQLDNYDNPTWGLSRGGTMSCNCNYLYLTDNLLDPSHVTWVHVTSFAGGGTEDTPLEIKVKDDGVIVSRWMRGREVPPYYAPLVTFEGPCDRLQHYEVRYPSIAINKSIFTPAGTGGDESNLPDNAYVMISYHFLTPVDENRTVYNWLQNRNTDPDNREITARIAAGARNAFEEDRLVLEAVHSGMANRSTPYLDLALDAGSLRFRKGLQALIDRETTPAPMAATA